jgi:predicted homoserine dehydrogenase-like protein
MVIVDRALRERALAGEPIRVAMVGAGVTGRSIALQLSAAVPGIRLTAIANRTPENAVRAFAEGGIQDPVHAHTPGDLDSAVSQGRCVVTEDPTVVCRAQSVDVIVEVTGTVDYAARVTLDAIGDGKHVVLVNAELDSTLGPILKVKADEAGVVVTNTDGDEPGVAMTLLRYLRSIGLQPVAAGNLKGMVDHYRTPETQRAFAKKYDQNVYKVTSFADATKLSMESALLANASGFRVGRRGMYGPACEHVREIAGLLPADQMLSGGIVDYALGAAPYTGAFVVVHEDHPLRRQHLQYYKLGSGPFYVFYTPYHLPHIQIASTIGRAALFQDATVAPLGAPICEVVSIAKRDLRAGEILDGVGGFCAYGLIENTDVARLAVDLPPDRLCDKLRAEQEARFPISGVSGAPAYPPGAAQSGNED